MHPFPKAFATAKGLFVDSSVWLGYFLGNIPATPSIVNSDETILFTSIISIYEVAKKLQRLGRTEKEARAAIEFIEDNSVIVNLSKQIALSAVENSEKYGLHTIDSLIYSSAMETKAIFVTADKGFRSAPNTKIIETGKKS